MTNHDQGLEVLRTHHANVTEAIDVIDAGIADLGRQREEHVALAVQLLDIIALVEQMDEAGEAQSWYKVTTADNVVHEIHARDATHARRLVGLAFPDLGILRVVTA
jgi:hypothetical protein